MKRRRIALLALCVTVFVSAAVALDITVLGTVAFDNSNQVKPAKLRVNFYSGENPGSYTVCVKPNGPFATACPVFKTGDTPQCQNVTFTSAPSQVKLTNILLQSKPREPGHAIRNCAVTYSIVPQGQPSNYFGRPEIGIPYRLK